MTINSKRFTIITAFILILFAVNGCSLQKADKQTDTAIDTNQEKLIDFVETIPEYPGGNEALVNFIKNNICYPQQAINDSIEGKVIVQFIIETDGSISEPTVLLSANEYLDNAAIEAVKKIPAVWKPARLQDKPVRSKFTVPVEFNLKKELLFDRVFEFVEVMPQFPGGHRELMTFLSTNIKYPEYQHSSSEEIISNFKISFIVEKDGSLSNVKLEKPQSPVWENTFKNVIDKMPKWNPGLHCGQPVRVRYIIPIHIDFRQ